VLRLDCHIELTPPQASHFCVKSSNAGILRGVEGGRSLEQPVHEDHGRDHAEGRSGNECHHRIVSRAAWPSSEAEEKRPDDGGAGTDEDPAAVERRIASSREGGMRHDLTPVRSARLGRCFFALGSIGQQTRLWIRDGSMFGGVPAIINTRGYPDSVVLTGPPCTESLRGVTVANRVYPYSPPPTPAGSAAGLQDVHVSP
jgi:hypothetical protein